MRRSTSLLFKRLSYGKSFTRAIYSVHKVSSFSQFLIRNIMHQCIDANLDIMRVIIFEQIQWLL
jgi:hypothetical protein